MHQTLTRIAAGLAQTIPGLLRSQSLLFVSPLAHTIRGVLLDRSGDPTLFYVHVFCQPLCVPYKHLALNNGRRLTHEHGALWNSADPDIVETLSATLMRWAIPFLSALESPRDVALAAKSSGASDDAEIRRQAAYAFARHGDVAQACRELDYLIAFLSQNGAGNEPSCLEAQQLLALLERDPAAAKRQLREWEASTVSNLKLLAFYSPD